MTRLPDAPIYIVTISREFGAGGSDPARERMKHPGKRLEQERR